MRRAPHEPQLIVLRYDPPGARDDFVLGLVGKAITFDSGGLSLKPPLRMQDMKGDMAGGAAVIEGTRGDGRARRCRCACSPSSRSTENVQAATAFRPGDILRAVERQDDRDHQHRRRGHGSILADALHYAREQGATHVIDFATLTGAMSRRARRPVRRLVRERRRLGRRRSRPRREASGDLGCRFPLHPRYRRYIDSDFADMKNGSELRNGACRARGGRSCRSSPATGRGRTSTWPGRATSRGRRPDYALDEGGTGYGVRLIVELAQRLAAA